MKYGLLKNNQFILIDDDLQRLKNTIPFMPDFQESNIQEFDDDAIEQGYDGAWYLKGHAPAIPADVALAKAKEARTEAVSKITVEVDGMVFDGNEKAQSRIATKVEAMQDGGTTKWVLADKSVATVTRAQLQKALTLASEKQTELWVKPYQE